VYLHPVISRDLIGARRADERRRAAHRHPVRSQSRSVPVRRSGRNRAGPLLRWRILRLS
jgi:hypothetical protein